MSVIIALAAVLSILGAAAGISRFCFRWAHSKGVSDAEKEFTVERQTYESKLRELQQKSEAQIQRLVSQLTKAKIRFAVEHQARLKAEEAHEQTDEKLRHMTELVAVLKDQLDRPDRRSRGA